QKSQPREKPAFRERLEHALDPFSKALPLSPSEVSRTRKWLIQAGYREPRHLTMYVGSRMLLALVGMLGVVAVEQGFDLLLMFGLWSLRSSRLTASAQASLRRCACTRKRCERSAVSARRSRQPKLRLKW